jgi:16S rRNA (cytosine1402-N4)-methyltransferase
MSEHYFSHYSVLKKECLDFLTEGAPKDSRFVDLTFGAGGHSFGLLEMGFRVVATDQDPEAIANGQKKILDSPFGPKIELIKSNFSTFPEIASDQFPGEEFQGILLDLGVSSHQFDKGERGFSFRVEAPLDMRMDSQNPNIKTAADLLNELSEEELADIFFYFGEERLARKIARRIVDEREEKPIKSTLDLENIIFHCYPKTQRFKGINPSTRTFQALRIAVNEELKVLDVLPKLLKFLRPSGKLLVISFHSLEDRIVKRAFKELEKGEIPCKILTKKPITPSEKEILENLRSRSAKLRVIERL